MYSEYLKFCEKYGYKPLPQADPFWLSNWAVRKASLKTDDFDTA